MQALEATAEHRGSTEQISDVEGILKQISESDDLKDMWRKYQKKFAYASDISYEDVLLVLGKYTKLFLVVGISLLLLFLLLTGSHNLLNYAIICMVDKRTTI